MISRQNLLLAAVPLVLAALSFVMMEVRGPYNLGPNIDPEYVALYNSLNIATFQPSFYFQHPATTLQIAGAGVIVAKWVMDGLSGNWEPLPETVIANDLEYLRAINLTLVAMLFVVAFWASRRVYQASGSYLPALAVPLTPLLYLCTVEALPRVAPELPGIIVGLALVIPLAPVVFGSDAEAASRRPALAIATGALLAAGVATKANFITLGLLILLFPGLRQKLRCAVSCLLTLVLLLLPIANRLPELWQWFYNMATRTGQYGQGEVGLPTQEAFRRNLLQLYKDEPFSLVFLAFYALLALAAVMAARGDEGRRLVPARNALLIGLAALLLHVALTLKHYGYHYILPAIMLMGLLNAAAAFLLQRMTRHAALRILLAALGLWCGYEGLRFNYMRMGWYAGSKALARENRAALAAARSARGDCLTIGYYRSSAPTYSHAFGLSLSGGRQQQALEAVHPGGVHYAASDGNFLFWNFQPARAEVERQVAEGACVLIEGEIADSHLVTGFQLEPLFIPEKQQWEAEGLWRLHLDAANPELIDAAEAPGYATVLPAGAFDGQGAAGYDVDAPEARRHVIRIRYASAGEPPLRVLLNGELIADFACIKPTGGHGEAHLKWHEIGAFPFRAGENRLRLETTGAPPEIDRLAVIPIR